MINGIKRFFQNLSISKTLFIISSFIKFGDEIQAKTGMKISWLRLSLYKMIPIKSDEIAKDARSRSEHVYQETIKIGEPLWEIAPGISEYLSPTYINIDLNNILVIFKPNYSLWWMTIKNILIIYGLYYLTTTSYFVTIVNIISSYVNF